MRATDMPIDSRNSGSQTIYHFEHIGNLSIYEEKYSPLFSLCNSTWTLSIMNDDNNLAIYLCKEEDAYENAYSYHVQFRITLQAFEGYKNISFDSQEHNPNSRYVFGKRDGELMEKGYRFIPWDDLLDPDSGFLDDEDEDIDIELYINIVRIYDHNDDCSCGAC